MGITSLGRIFTVLSMVVPIPTCTHIPCRSRRWIIHTDRIACRASARRTSLPTARHGCRRTSSGRSARLAASPRCTSVGLFGRGRRDAFSAVRAGVVLFQPRTDACFVEPVPAGQDRDLVSHSHAVHADGAFCLALLIQHVLLNHLPR